MASHNSFVYRTVFFIALLSTALALGAALAHALELPNKIRFSRDQYLIVQQIYRGWNQLAYLLLVEFLSMIALAVMSWRDRYVFWSVVFAILCLLSAQAVFWVFTYPANEATNNWTAARSDWEALRAQWEYSHAVGAFFQVLAMSALIASLLGRKQVAN